MKKNISINISGIIFHIEEDGYDTLKKYLDSINKYFSSFEDSSEILADIESRIAEIFLSKLNEEKQVITQDDVNSLIATMGSVSDFKAAEDTEAQEEYTTEAAEEPKAESASGLGAGSTPPQPPPPPSFTPPKQLMRDQKRKILGGVCSGLANYFNIDSMWVRLLFAAFFFVYGMSLIAYIILWIVLPGSYDLDEPVVPKKMFRDPERKIIGGVAGGVAAFLNIDVIAVRVIFIVLTIGGGLGVFLYIVLWIILPEARTLTDRVQMQGEPVTLSNIESTIKKSQTDKVAEDESTLTKVLLFPFRLIGMILRGVGRILVPILELIRVAIGVMIVAIGMCLVFGFVVSAGVLFGIFSAASLSLPWMSEFTDATVPVDVFLRAFPVWLGIAAFIGSLVPSIFIVFLGVSVIAKRIIFSATAGWTLFVLFFVSVAMLAVGIPKIVFSFREDGGYKVENTYTINGKTAVLQINEVGMDNYRNTHLSLRGYEGKDFRLISEFEAKGSTRAKAIENARMVDYTMNVRDSIFTFDSNVQFKEDAIFRAQKLDMTLYIPYNQPFTMDEGVSRLVTEYIDWKYRDGQTWRMTEASGLECITCPKVEEEQGAEEQQEDWDASLTNFDEVEISGKFDVRINAGGDYKVELIGSDSEKEKYKIYRAGSTLVIEYANKRGDVRRLLNTDDMRINITMPSLRKLEATGMGSIRFDAFQHDNLEIESTGPIEIRGEVNTRRLFVNLSGKSELELSGTATSMDAQLELASKLRAYSLNVEDAIVEVSGGSNAKVNVTQNLEVEEGLGSEVDYRGNPNVVKRD